MKTTGIVLIIIGIILTAVTSIKFFTKEKVVDIGNLELTHEKPNRIDWPPALGVVIIVIGGVVLWRASKNS